MDGERQQVEEERSGEDSDVDLVYSTFEDSWRMEAFKRNDGVVVNNLDDGEDGCEPFVCQC